MIDWVSRCTAAPWPPWRPPPGGPRSAASSRSGPPSSTTARPPSRWPRWPRQTSTITLASGIAYAVGRSPLVLACEARDLDELSGGRLLLGLGTGTTPHAAGLARRRRALAGAAVGGAGAAAAPDLGDGRRRCAARGPLLPDGPAADGRGHAAPADPGLPGRVQRADGAGRRGGGRRPGRAPDLHPALRERGGPAGAGRRGGPNRARHGRPDRRLRDLQRGRRRRPGPPRRRRADRVLRRGSDLRDAGRAGGVHRRRWPRSGRPGSGAIRPG